MVVRIKVIVLDHYDTTVESVASNKEDTVNAAIMALEETGKTVIGLTETVVNTSYTEPVEGSHRDYHYNSSGTVVTILYTDVNPV